MCTVGGRGTRAPPSNSNSLTAQNASMPRRTNRSAARRRNTKRRRSSRLRRMTPRSGRRHPYRQRAREERKRLFVFMHMHFIEAEVKVEAGLPTYFNVTSRHRWEAIERVLVRMFEGPPAPASAATASARTSALQRQPRPPAPASATTASASVGHQTMICPRSFSTEAAVQKGGLGPPGLSPSHCDALFPLLCRVP